MQETETVRLGLGAGPGRSGLAARRRLQRQDVRLACCSATCPRLLLSPPLTVTTAACALPASHPPTRCPSPPSIARQMIKPVYGFLSDAVPLFGYRRRSYLAICGLLGAAAWTGMGLCADSAHAVVLLLVLGSASTACADVVADSVVVQLVRRPGSTMVRLGRVCWRVGGRARFCVPGVRCCGALLSLARMLGRGKHAVAVRASARFCVAARGQAGSHPRPRGGCGTQPCVLRACCACRARQARCRACAGPRPQPVASPAPTSGELGCPAAGQCGCVVLVVLVVVVVCVSVCVCARVRAPLGGLPRRHLLPPRWRPTKKHPHAALPPTFPAPPLPRPCSGSLVGDYGPRIVFLLTAAFPLLVTGAALAIPEERVRAPGVMAGAGAGAGSSAPGSRSPSPVGGLASRPHPGVAVAFRQQAALLWGIGRQPSIFLPAIFVFVWQVGGGWQDAVGWPARLAGWLAGWLVVCVEGSGAGPGWQASHPSAPHGQAAGRAGGACFAALHIRPAHPNLQAAAGHPHRRHSHALL